MNSFSFTASQKWRLAGLTALAFVAHFIVMGVLGQMDGNNTLALLIALAAMGAILGLLLRATASRSWLWAQGATALSVEDFPRTARMGLLLRTVLLVFGLRLITSTLVDMFATTGEDAGLIYALMLPVDAVITTLLGVAYGRKLYARTKTVDDDLVHA